ncbi:hypothetical protein BDN67DRAFT_1072787 [Paxillus ammoniavirescens]|nr:hypothetical protein BDN67DRAFT_1072787 [Paxillus ammoniavirescens]
MVFQSSEYADERHVVVSETHLTGGFGSTVSYSESSLRREFEYTGLRTESIYPRSIFPRGVLFPVSCDSLSQLVEQFPHFTRSDLGSLATVHGVFICRRAPVDEASNFLRHHSCGPECADKVYVFRARKSFRRHVPFVIPPLRNIEEDVTSVRTTRRLDRVQRSDKQVLQERQRRAAAYASRYEAETRCFPPTFTLEDKICVIREWQHGMAPENQIRSPCAVCAHRIQDSMLEDVDPTPSRLAVLKKLSDFAGF